MIEEGKYWPLHFTSETRPKFITPKQYSSTLKVHRIFRALQGDQRSRMIKFIIEKEETNVTTIYSQLKIAQPVASRELKTLRESKIVKSRRVGKQVLYSINWSVLDKLIKKAEEILSCVEQE